MKSVYRAWGIRKDPPPENKIDSKCMWWKGSSTYCPAAPVTPKPTSPKHYLVPGSAIPPYGPPSIPSIFKQEIAKLESQNQFCPCSCTPDLNFNQGPFGCYRPVNTTCVKNYNLKSLGSLHNQYYIAPIE